MSTQLLPSIPGITYPWTRKPMFQTRKQEAISGKETRIADWSTPRYQWTLPVQFLRTGTFFQATYAEYATLESFFESLLGGWDTWLYQDAYDFSVTGQGIGAGTGSQTTFPMVRTFGTNAGPILAPDTTDIIGPLSVYIGGTLQSSSGYVVTSWGTSNGAGPGQLIFTAAPSNGALITASFSYFWPVHFDDDGMDFSAFMSNLAEVKKMSFTSVK